MDDKATSMPGSFSKDYYDRANEAFASQNFQKAVDKYGEAIAHDPFNVDYLCARAHAHLKLDEFEKAKTDANKAIGNYLQRLFLKEDRNVLKHSQF